MSDTTSAPTADPVLVQVARPGPAAMRAARKAYRLQGRLCGCHAQLSRNPFYRGVIGHFATFHPGAEDVLRDAQAQALVRIARELTLSADPPWPSRSLPQPVKIG